MKWINRLGLAQRIVIIVALGFALFLVGAYIGATESRLYFGSFGYPPLGISQGFVNGATAYEARLSPGQTLSVWIGLIVGWTVVSFVLLRPPRSE